VSDEVSMVGRIYQNQYKPRIRGSVKAADGDLLERAYEAVLHEPGMRKSRLMQLMGIRSMQSLLVTMERYGYLLMEDDKGKLYSFGRSYE
jgi:hypothetical protein